MVGPIKLVQGNVAIINRYPIFLEEGNNELTCSNDTYASGLTVEDGNARLPAHRNSVLGMYEYFDKENQRHKAYLTNMQSIDAFTFQWRDLNTGKVRLFYYLSCYYPFVPPLHSSPRI